MISGLLYVGYFLTIYALWSEPYMLAFYGISLVGVGIAVSLTKLAFQLSGAWFSSTFLLHLRDPLKKKTTMKKWKDQAWQLVIHVSMSIFEFYILLDETWWSDTDSMWNYDAVSKSCSFGAIHLKLKVFFILQMAIWGYTAFSCKFLEEHRKDYLVMMTHHVLTIMLVAFCYINQYLPFGLCILYLHDVSDISLDLLKMVNYIKLGGSQGLFVTEISFAVVLINWFYFRVYLFPQKILQSTMFDSVRLCPPSSSLGAKFFPDTLPYYAAINGMLSALWVLHIWWSFLILRLLAGIFTKGTHQSAEDEYEGVSSDSDKED